MRVLAFSDIHCDQSAAEALVAASQEADLVIGAGDFAERHEGLAGIMAALSPMDDKALYIPGNNETFEALETATKAQVIHRSWINRDGVTFAGIGCAIPPLPPVPWSSYDLTEEKAAETLGRIGPAEVLITHSPPKGVVDRHAELGSIGSQAVHDWIVKNRPRVVLCGHIHDCWGQVGMIGRTQVMNLGPRVTWVEI